jgi:hypothetical protein
MEIRTKTPVIRIEHQENLPYDIVHINLPIPRVNLSSGTGAHLRVAGQELMLALKELFESAGAARPSEPPHIPAETASSTGSPSNSTL